MTKSFQLFLLSTVLATAACGTSKPANNDATGSGGKGGTTGSAGSGGTTGTAGTGASGTTGTAGTGGATGVAGTGGGAGTSGSDAAAGTTGAAGNDGGTDGGTTTTTNIKAAAGGTITAQGLTVTIPPGALMADTDITVAVSDGAGLPAAATLAAKVYDLGPTGTTFLKAVSITIDFDAAKVVAPKVATVAFLEAGAWVALAGSFRTGTKASAPTMHFTPFSAVSMDPVVNNCVAMGPGLCQTCCKTTFASGEKKVIPNIIQTCACAASAPCNAQCAANVCMGLAVTPECKTCFDAETSKSNSVCFDQGLIACMTMSDCKDYSTCGISCP